MVIKMAILSVQNNIEISFSTPEVWSFLLQIFFIALAILLGNVIRRKVPFMKRSLIPTALIGGLLILMFKSIPLLDGFIDKRVMELITYHALAIGFIAMSLRSAETTNKSSTVKVVETGAITASTYVVQGIIGLIVTVGLYLVWLKWGVGDEVYYAGGLLLPMGYGQGPGQALNFGTIYQGWAEGSGISFYGIDFGLSIASIGFIVGSVIGVIYMNLLKKRGKLKISSYERDETHTLEDYESENELPHSESVDKMTIVVCFVLFTYFLVYLFMTFIGSLNMGSFGEKTIKPLVYGFNFFWGILFGSFVKVIIKGFRRFKWMNREYLNNYILNRLSGFSFDIMIVAGTAAINFGNVRTFLLPLTLACVLGAIITFYYVLAVSKHIYPDYKYEGFFSMFGMLTGTASNGMILLREIDPKYETPAANNLVLQNIPALALGFPILLLLGYAPQSLRATLITLVILILLYSVFLLYLFRTKIFRRYGKKEK